MSPIRSVETAILQGGWVRKLQWFDEIDSTNSAARRLLRDSRDDCELPALLVADRQTAGRGRRQNQWWSPEGCLMFTLAVPGKLLPDDPSLWGQLALVSGVALAESLAEFAGSTAVGLKWPNDVYLQGRKVAGILIESVARGASAKEKPDWLIGAGVNVDMDWRSAPEDVARRAGCLRSCAAVSVDREVVLEDLVRRLGHAMEQWRLGRSHWRASWLQRCLLSGRTIRLSRGAGTQGELLGLCLGIDTMGQLLLRDEQGVHSLNSAEAIEFV